ncbi:fosmidomycin resistance protein [Candidatus Vecturithrix granuli]|uniref:Fosmidomycin resistance protein n=1 Tax=Vecturithrix granuli TaxID=1499967 RepID=A0A081BW94_VECG1|nr:fosmidomycin resistance protein [Candidatus Vecturithrix granuli]
MKPTPTDQKFHTGNVLLIAFSHLIQDMYTAFLAPLLPLLIEKLRFSYALAGFLTAALNLPSLMNPWLGALADKLRLRHCVIISPIVTAISMSLLGLAPSYAMLLVLLTITGISSACYHVPTPVMITRIAGTQVGKGMSFYMFGGELARTIGPLVIVGAVSLWGLEATYKLIIPGVFASGFLYLKLNKLPLQQPFHCRNQAANLRQTSYALLPFFLGLAGITLFMGAMKAAMISFLPSYLMTKGIGISAAGVYLAILQGGGVVGVLASGYLSDTFGRKTILLVTAIVSPLLMSLFLLAPAILIFPILLLLGFFLLSTGPVILAVVQESNSEYPAYVNGVYMMISFVVTSLITVLVGALSDRIGFENTYWISLLWFFGTIPCLWLLPGHLTLPAFVTRSVRKLSKEDRTECMRK